MRFDIADVTRVGVRFRQRPTDRAALRLRVRHCISIGLPAVIESTPANDAVNMIPILFRLGKTLQDHNAHSFSGNVSVTAFAETLAVALAGDELTAAQHQVFVRMDADIDPAGNGQAGAFELQVLAGGVDRRQGGRAHRIHRHARSVQVQRIRDSVCDAGRAASHP